MIWIWSGFILFVLGVLALDLGVFHRKAHVVSLKESLLWSAIWISLALFFSVFVFYGYDHHWLGLGSSVDVVDGTVNDGAKAWIKYLTGYVVEKSLSVDNIFVIAMIFSFFTVPLRYQHRVLFWGILGAILLRGAMIFLGAHLIARFSWILYLFGAFLIVTGIRMFWMKTDEIGDPTRNPLLKLARRFFPVTEQFHGQHFAVRAGSTQSHEGTFREDKPSTTDQAVEKAPPGRWMLTPLAMALILVETSDVIFAVDSIPAIFAITADPFLVFTSNIFAILGLRSLYFALAGMLDKFQYLKPALSIVLALVGVKMLTHKWLKQFLGEYFEATVLAVVLGILLCGVLLSLWRSRQKKHAKPAAQEQGGRWAVDGDR